MAIMMIGGAAYLAHSIYDIAVLPGHIRKHNERMKNKVSFNLAPLLIPNQNSNTYGLQLALGF